MERKAALLCFFILVNVTAMAQYRVEAEVLSAVGTSCDPLLYNPYVRIGDVSQSSSDYLREYPVTIFDKNLTSSPSKVYIEFGFGCQSRESNGNIISCLESAIIYKTFSLSAEPCTVQFLTLSDSCTFDIDRDPARVQITMGIIVTPLYEPLPLESNYICESDEVSVGMDLSGRAYHWAFRKTTSIDTEQNFYFSPGGDHHIDFNLTDLFGPDYLNYWDPDEGIIVEGRMGSCPPKAIGPLFFVPAVPDILSVRTIPPECSDGSGSIEILHDANFSAGQEFLYTITQFIAAPDGSCGDGPSGGNIKTCDEILFSMPESDSFIESYCEQGQVSTFCSGFIGNFSKALFSHELGDRTVLINEDLSISKSEGNSIKLLPGIYRLDVEAMGTPAGVSCAKTFYVEIPETDYIRPTISNPTIASRPSCIGGNDGAVAFTVQNGKSNFEWFVNKIGSSSVISSATNVSSFTTDKVLKYSSADAYEIIVIDGCSTSVKKTFRLAEDGLNHMQISTNLAGSNDQLGCFDSNGNGEGRWRIDVGANRPPATTNYSYKVEFDNTFIEAVDGLSHTFSALSYPEYKVIVTAPNECQASMSKTFVAPKSLQGSFAKSSPCFEDSNGSIVFTKSSGSENLSISVNGGPYQPVTPVNNTVTLSNFSKGTYEVIAKDNCIESNPIGLDWSVASGALTLTELKPLAFDSNPAYTNVNENEVIHLACYGDTKNVSIGFLDGKGPYNAAVTRNGAAYEAFSPAASPIALPSVPSGTYRISIWDGCGDVIERNFTIQSPAQLNASMLTKDLTCYNNESGEIQVVISGGSPLVDNDGSFNYSVRLYASGTLQSSVITVPCADGNENCVNFIKLSANIPYHIAVTDKEGCTRVFNEPFNTKTLSQPAPLSLKPITASSFSNHVEYPTGSGSIYSRCYGDAAIILSAIPDGGTEPYHFSLKKKGGATWSSLFPPQSSNVFASLSAGLYRAYIDDTNNCESVPVNFEIREAEAPIHATLDALEYPHGFHTSCYGKADGEITVVATGGVGQYQFSFSDGINDLTSAQNISPPLSAIDGDRNSVLYHVSVVDALGCQWKPVEEKSAQIELHSPMPVWAHWQQRSEEKNNYEIPCHGDSAEISITAEGGHAFDYSYSIFDASNLNNRIFAATITGEHEMSSLELPAGDYLLKLHDGLSCPAANLQFSLKQPVDPLIAVIDNIVSPPCIDGDDGQIYLSASGGPEMPEAVYDFFIKRFADADFDTEIIRGTSALFLRPADVYEAQQYDVRVIDDNGCAVDLALQMPPTNTPLTLTLTRASSPSCYGGNNGYIELEVEHAAPQDGSVLIYKISGGHFGLGATRTIEANSLKVKIDNLEGTDIGGNVPYRVWVEDGHECEFMAYQIIEGLTLKSFEPLQVSLQSESVLQPSCYNGTDALVSVIVSGGVEPYLFSREGATYEAVGDNNQILLPNLSSGAYTLYIRDVNYVEDQPACQFREGYHVNEGRRLVFDATINHVSCKGGNDGAIDLMPQIKNLVAPEVYDPTSLSLEWRHESISSGIISDEEDISGLFEGIYKVRGEYRVRDKICAQESSFSVPAPAKLFSIVDIVTYPAACGSFTVGRAVVSTEGGWPSSPRYYRLDGGEWTIFTGDSFLLSKLSQGRHIIEVAQEDFLCTDTASFSIVATPLPLGVSYIGLPTCPGNSDGFVLLESQDDGVYYAMNGGAFQTSSLFENLTAGVFQFTAVSINDETCQSDTIEADISDPIDCGDGPLAANILFLSPTTCHSSADGAAALSARGGVPPYEYYWDNSSTPGEHNEDNLSPGMHSVQITDRAGASVTLNFEITARPLMAVETFLKAASCESTCDGTIDLLITGGSGKYTVRWSDGTRASSRKSLCPGTYGFVITDQNHSDCFINGEVIVGHQPSLALDLKTLENPSCPGFADGAIAVDALGGSGRYRYEWSNNAGTPSIKSLPAGEYWINVTDAVYGCSLQQTFRITDPPEIEVIPTLTPPSCYGGSDGKISLSFPDRTNMLVQWSNREVGSTLNQIASGTYSCTITDSKGCSIENVLSLPDTEQLITKALKSDVSCFGKCDGRIALSWSGGTGPYRVQWDHGPKTADLSKLCAGRYRYSVIDRNGCEYSEAIDVGSPSQIQISLMATNPSCYGSSDGSITASASGGTGGYNYVWNTGEEGNIRSKLPKGRYSVTAVDSSGCLMQNSISIVAPRAITLNAEQVTGPKCAASNDGAIQVLAQGGSGSYSYLWSDGDINRSRIGLTHGVFTVESSDQNGCKVSQSFALIAPPVLMLSKEQVSHPSCFANQDGAIAVEVNGGTSPYAFSWNNTMSGSSVSALGSGNYELVVSDKNGCVHRAVYMLSDPPEKLIEGIPLHTVICEGSEALFKPNGNWSRFEWRGVSGIHSTAETFRQNAPGEYQLTTWNSDGCPATIKFQLEVSANALTADFLRLSEAVVGRPIVFIDISNPLPQKLEWIMPIDEDVIVNQMSSSLLEVTFLRADDFEVGIKAQTDNCKAEQIKMVTIVNEPRPDEGGRFREIDETLEVKIYPNPVSHELKIVVRSPDRKTINLRLVSSLDNRLSKTENLVGYLDYRINWTLDNVASGLHYLIITHDGSMSTKRIVVFK